MALVFHNRLESANPVSEIGGNGTDAGTVDYAAGKWGNGARVDANGEAVTFGVEAVLRADAGSIDWWYNPNSAWTDGKTPAHIQGMVVAANNTLSERNACYGSTTGFWWYFYRGAASGFGAVAQVIAAMDMVAGSLSHFALVWDKAGIGGGANTCRIYFDGNMVASTNNAITNPLAFTGFSVGNLFPLGVWGSTQPADGIIDNLRFWSTALTDWSARKKWEYAAPSAPGGVTATVSVVTNEVVMDWTAVTDADTYNLYYTTDGSNPTTASASVAGLTGIHYHHAGLLWGTVYKYGMTTVIGGVEGTISAIATAGITLPDIVANPTATAAPTTNAITVDCTPTTGATSYKLYWTDDGTAPTLASAHIDGIAMSYYHDGLTFGSLYSYALLATDATGDSIALSLVASAMVTARHYHPPELIVPKWASLEIGGYVVVDRMSDLPKFREEVSSSADAVFAGTAEIDARNFDGSFSLGNPLSFFAGTNWQGKQVILRDRWGDIAWDGLLEGVDVDEGSRQTKITSRSRLYRWRDERVDYTSAAPETPAGALQNIFAAVGFEDYHDGTLQASVDAQAADGLSIQVTLVPADNATLAQVVSQLAVYGVADVWEHLGLLYYRYADLSAARSVGTLDADDLIGDLKISRGTRELVNDYAIPEAGIPSTVTDATAGNIGAASRLKNGTRQLKTISGTAVTQYVPQDVVTAQTIGERWISWTNVDPITDPRPRVSIEFDVRSDLRSVMAIGTDFALTYQREGWTAKTWRIVAIERDDEKRRLTIKAVEW